MPGTWTAADVIYASWTKYGRCLIKPVIMETRCFHKKLEFRRYPPKDLCTARYEHKSSKKKFQTFQKPRKKSFLGPSWAKIGLRKLSQMFVRSGEIPSPGQTSIDKTNDCTMKSERGALVRASYPPSGHSTKRPVIGGGRRRGV